MDDGVKKWLSYHLANHTSVYGNEMDDFLGKNVATIINHLQLDNLIDKFFFIRYAEAGPHIRLRLHSDVASEAVIYDTIRLNGQKYFAKILKSNLSEKITTQLPKQFQVTFFEDQSINKIEYIKETDRFGGIDAIKIVEDEFCNSSKFALEIFATNQNISRTQKLWISYLMLNYFLTVVFQEEYEEWVIFLVNYSRAALDAEMGDIAAKLWEDGAGLYQYMRNYNKNAMPKFVACMYSHFNKRYEYFSDVINKKTQTIFESTNKMPIYMSKWHDNLYVNLTALKKLASTDKIKLHTFTDITAKQKFIAIIASILHLHNNRLGLSLIDEAWISFSLAKWLNTNKV